MLAPLLYMLALGGIGAAVMFSGYSQVLRSNAEMTAINTVRQQLNSAGQTLSASAALDSATSTIVQPPNVQLFSAVTDTARLPGNYAAVNATGTPHSYGVVDVNTGVRQLDPWGKYYVYCRWENPVSNAAAPSIMVISGGPDGLLSTKCGDTAAQGDDRLNKLTVAEAINRANVWQVNSSSQVKFGIQADAVKVNDDGSMEAKSLTLATPLAITSGGTGAVDAVGARTNLSVPSNTGNGASGLWDIGISGNAATATALLTPRDVSIAGSSGLVASAIAFDGTADVALALGGTLAIANGGTGAVTSGGARTNLGSTAIGDALFTTANAAAARTTLGATATGTALFTAADAAAARITLGLGSMAIQNADNVAITGGTISGADLTGSTMPGSGVTGSVGSADTVPASGITGIVSLAQGGTGVAASSNANLRNLIGTDNASNLLSGTLSEARLPLVNPSPAGTYGWGTIDAYGRVLEAREIAANAITQGNSGVSVSDTGSDGTVTITTEGLARLTVGPTGNVGIGTAGPADKLDVNGNVRVRGAAGSDRSLLMSTLGSNRWSVSTNAVAESGSDAGSNFVVTRYSDAGTAIGNALAINRATGAISTSGDIAIGGAATATGGFYGTFTGTFNGMGSSQWLNGTAGAIYYSGGNVGIGTTAPATPLDVVGYVRSGGASSGLVFGGRDGGAGFQWYANLGNASLWDNTNSVSRIFVTPTGNVGIGTTAPAAKLQVSGGALLLDNSQYIAMKDSAGLADEILGVWSDDFTKLLSAKNGIDFQNDAGSTLVRIQDGGNVGIGTTAPSSALDLNGAQTFRGMVAPAVSPAGQGRMYFDSTANVFKVSQNGGAYTTLGGGGALSALSDVALGSPANGHVLTYNGAQWVNAAPGTAMTTTTMVASFPDAIRCHGTIGSAILYRKYDNTSTGSAVYAVGWSTVNSGDADLFVNFNNSGAVASTQDRSPGTWTGWYESSCFAGQTVTGLYAAGRAFNFLGSSLASASAPSGGVQFNNGSGVLAGDTALIWDNTTKRLGIGTSNPTSHLHLSTATSGAIRFDGNTGGSAPALASVLHLNSNIDPRGRGMYMTTTDAAAGAAWFVGVPYNGGGFQIGSSSVHDPFAANSSGYAANAKLFINAAGNVGIGTTSPTASALLDITSTTKGLLPPRMTTAQRDAIASPATGLQVYNTTTSALNVFNGTAWGAVGGGGALSALTDVTLTSTANNDILRYDSTSSKWKNVSLGAALSGTSATTTMEANFPDAIVCTTGSIKQYMNANHSDGTNLYYEAPYSAVGGSRYWVGYSLSTGAYAGSQSNMGGSDCVTGALSVSALYAAGKAFNFIGSSLASAAAPAGGIQFNNGAGALAGDTALIWDNASKALGIGTATPSSKAVLDLSSTTKGFLPPRMTTAQRDAIAAPSTGLIVYNTTNAALEMFNGASWTSVGSALPNGAIAAFASASCPSGWSEYTPARGRFLRGIDNGVGLDSGGTRAPGHQQTDATAINGLSATTNASLNILSPQPNTGGAHDLSRGPSAGSVTLASTDTETRPYNVAVTFCQYNGSGGGGGATALVALSDVAISGATNGQVLTYDGTAGKWINQSGGGTSQWTTAGANIHYNSGNVGIGSTTPENKLTLASGGIGLTYATAANSGGIGLGPDTSSGSYNFSYTNSQGTYLTRHYGMTILPNASPEVYLAGYGGLGLIAGGANRLHITTAGNVGIGTTAPVSKLNVTDGVNPYTAGTGELLQLKRSTTNSAASGATAISIGNASNLFRIVYGGTSDRLGFVDGGNIEALSIMNGGNVGIGTTNPLVRLDVRNGSILAGDVSSTNGSVILQGYYSGSDTTAVFGTQRSSGAPVLGYGVRPSTSAAGSFLSSASTALPRAALVVGDAATGTGDIKFYTGSSQTVPTGSAVTLSPVMTIRNNGNVGIGTVNPSKALDVVGDIRSNDTNGSVSFGNDADPSFIARAGGAGYHTSNSAAGDLAIRVMPGQKFLVGTSASGTTYTRLAIDTSGNVGIGTTAPGAKLHVTGNSKIETGVLDLDPGYSIRWGGAASGIYSGSGVSDMVFTVGSSERFRVNGSSGNVGIGTAVPTQLLHVNGTAYATTFLHTSDRRLKTDISSIATATQLTTKLRGVHFKWKKDGVPAYGVIAQEVEAVMPDAVTTNADGTKAVDYDQLIPVLIEAVKSLQVEIDALKRERAH